MIIDIQSIFIYVGMAFLSFFIAKDAERHNNKKLLWVIVTLLALLSGLRAISVGIDTKTYNQVFRLIANGTVKRIYGMEESFIYICAALLRIWNNTHFLLFLFAFISNGLVMFRLWKDRKFLAFRWSVLAYYITFFPFSLNGMRQFVAIAIIFYATSLVKEGKYFKYVFLTILASLFHTTAIIGLAYIAFDLIFMKYFDEKRKRNIFLLICIGGVFGISQMIQLTNIYSKYFDRMSSSVGFMMVVKILMLLLSIFAFQFSNEKEERYFLLSHRWNYVVGILLNSLSYIFLYMGRIGWYFYIFEAIYIGYLFKSEQRTIWTFLLKFGYFAVLVYYLYDNVTHGGQGEIPYRFLWQ